VLGAVLVSFLLLWALLPKELRQPAHAQNNQKKARRVYTNDDPPFNSSRPSSPPAAADTAPAPAVPSEGEKIAPFVATPMEIVDKMLEMAAVKADDVVYDLGSGDGRIPIRAAQKYGAKGVGIEIDRRLVQESQEKVQELKLEDKVTIIQGDLLQSNIKPATVVAVYLLPGANEKLRPILEKDLKPGTRVVVHDIRIPGWEASREEAVPVGGGTHYVYLYLIPEAFKK
jgi:protein-L-isoaspartate O-methyltransferase